MSTTTRAVIQGIKTALKQIDGTGSYNVDISDNASEIYHAPKQGDARPMVRILPQQIPNKSSTATSIMMTDLSVTLVGYPDTGYSDGGTVDALDAQIAKCYDLADDIHRALCDDITLGSKVITVIPVRSNVPTNRANLDSAYCVLEFRIRYETQRNVA